MSRIAFGRWFQAFMLHWRLENGLKLIEYIWRHGRVGIGAYFSDAELHERIVNDVKDHPFVNGGNFGTLPFLALCEYVDTTKKL